MKNKNNILLLRGVIALLVIGIFISLSRIASAEHEIRSLKKTEVELSNKVYETERDRDSLQLELDSLHTMSWETIEYWVDTLQIAHKDVVMRQIMLETGWLTSDICQENNNLFGMKEPRVRETTALGTKRNHAYYENYIDSIKDYKLWQEDRNVNDDIDYYQLLSSVGYAEATNYINTLKSI